MKQVFVKDFDIPIGEYETDALSALKRLSKYIDKALECKISYGKLETKDAFRIRIKGIFETV